MNDLTNADLIWNRACLGDLSRALEGHLALAMLLISEAEALMASSVDLELHEAAVDRHYCALVPDRALSERFEAILRDKPSEFALI